MGTPNKGDRVELIHTGDPYTNLRPGDRGVVTDVRDALGEPQVWIDWDGGSRLAMLPTHGDRVRVVEGEDGDLADEFAENGLGDVADHLREHGVRATREWINGVIADARENDDPEGWRLGNLETARDRLDIERKP